jgi:hypothetical protein
MSLVHDFKCLPDIVEAPSRPGAGRAMLEKIDAGKKAALARLISVELIETNQ